MKKQRLIFSLLLSTITFSSLSFGEWIKSAESEDGSFYINFSDIREADGYVYWWQLNDLIEPNKGTLSATTYHQTDCGWFRTKYLRGKRYKANMAENCRTMITKIQSGFIQQGTYGTTRERCLRLRCEQLST